MAFRDQTSAMAYMSQHFVALMCDYETHNSDGTWTKQKPVAFSGFLLELHGVGFWVTAGHCLKDELDKPLRRGQIRITGGAFLDHFGHEAVFEQGVPFTYEAGCGYYVESPEYGLDFALVSSNFKCNKPNALDLKGFSTFVHDSPKILEPNC